MAESKEAIVDPDELPELTACYQQHMKQIEDALEESESDSEVRSDEEEKESSDTDNSADWDEESNPTRSRVSRLVCSRPVQQHNSQDIAEDLEGAQPLDWSDSETESYLDHPSHSPLLEYIFSDVDEQEKNQDPEERDTTQEEDLSQEEEESSAEEEGSADSVSGTTAGPEVGYKLNLRSSNTGRKDGQQDNRKGRRRKFSSHQLEELEKVYSRDPYPDPSEKAAVAARLNIDLHRVKVWFQNRRYWAGRPRLKRKEKTSADKREGGKEKRARFSPDQVEELEKSFKQLGPYPEAFVRDELATKLNVNQTRVRVWFQHRRYKWKREEKPKMKSTRRMRTAPKASTVHTQRTSGTVTKKGRRTTFLAEQIEEMEAAFRDNPYLPKPARDELAKRLDLDQIKVQNWMYNRRAKWIKRGKPKLSGTSRRSAHPNPPDTPSETTHRRSQSDNTLLTRKRKNEEEEAGKATRGKKLTRELRSLLPSLGSPKQEKQPQTVETLLEDMFLRTKPRQLKPAQASSGAPSEASSSSSNNNNSRSRSLKKGRSGNRQTASHKKQQDSSPEVEETEKTGERGKRRRRKVDNSCFQEPPDTSQDTLPDPGHQAKGVSSKPGRAQKMSQEPQSATQTQGDAGVSGSNAFLRPEGPNSDDEKLISRRSYCNNEVFFIKKADINKASPPIYKYNKANPQRNVSQVSQCLPQRYEPYKWEEQKWYYIQTNSYSLTMGGESDPNYLQVKVMMLQKETVGTQNLQLVKWMPGEVPAIPLPKRDKPPSTQTDGKQPSSAAVSNNKGPQNTRHRSPSQSSSTSSTNTVASLLETTTEAMPTAASLDNKKAATEIPSTRENSTEAVKEECEPAEPPVKVESTASVAGTPSTSGTPGAGQSPASPPAVTSTSAPGDRESPCQPWGVNKKTFHVYLQTLTSYALAPSFLDEIEEDGDMYFLMAVETVDTKVREAKERVMQNVTFDPEYKAAVEKYPYLNKWSNNTLGNQTCQACLTKQPATQTLNLRGRPYNRSTLKEWPGEKGSKMWSVCQFCAEHTQTFHQLHHFKYRLFRKCENKVTAVQRSHQMSSDEETCKYVFSDRGWVSELHEELEELLCRAQQNSNS